MKFALLPNLTRENSFEVTLEVCKKLDALNAPYMFSDNYKEDFHDTKAGFMPFDNLLGWCDVIVTIGGDGTIIHAAKNAVLCGKPILGVNAGKLAFMAGIERFELHLFSNLLNGNYTIDKRMLLHARLMSGNDILVSRFCLNDAVISGTGKMKLVELSVECNGKHLNNYVGDGIILATPTGSTAYSLSAGGPIVDPVLESILLTPICAHSLHARPFILKADSVFSVTALPGSEVAFSCDGEEPVLIPKGCHISIRKADLSAEFIRVKTDTFIDVLNKKMAQWHA